MMEKQVDSKETFALPAALMLALQSVFATQVQLSRIVFLQVSRLLLRLPRNVTIWNTISPSQRPFLLNKVAPLQSSGNRPRRLPLHDESSTPIERPAAAERCDEKQSSAQSKTEGPIRCPPHGSVTQATLRNTLQNQAPVPRVTISSPTTTAGYSMVVNVAGHGTIVNTDELVTAVGRQARAWQTRNKKLLQQARAANRSEAVKNNLVINISGSQCVVGGAATVNEAIAGKKRNHEESSEGTSKDSIKGEVSASPRPSRRQRRT